MVRINFTGIFTKGSHNVGDVHVSTGDEAVDSEGSPKHAKISWGFGKFGLMTIRFVISSCTLSHMRSADPEEMTEQLTGRRVH